MLERSGYSCDKLNESDFVEIFVQLKAKQTCRYSKRRRLRRLLQPGWVQMLRKEKEILHFLSPGFVKWDRLYFDQYLKK